MKFRIGGDWMYRNLEAEIKRRGLSRLALAEQMGCTLQAELEDGRFGVRIAWKPYAPRL